MAGVVEMYLLLWMIQPAPSVLCLMSSLGPGSFWYQNIFIPFDLQSDLGLQKTK